MSRRDEKSRLEGAVGCFGRSHAIINGLAV